MTDLLMLLIPVVSGIIGYQLAGLIDRSIDRYTSGSPLPENGEESE